MVEENMYEKYDNNVKDIIAAQEGSKSAMEKLINDNQGLLWSIIKRFSGRGYELDDLYQIACIGFIKCIKRFDTNFEVRLSTYAVPYILGEVKRHIQDNGPIKVSRASKEMCAKISLVEKEYFKKTGKEMGIEEIAKELGVSKEEIAMALDSKNPVSSIYEMSNYHDEEGVCIIDKLSNQVDEQSIVINKITIHQLICDLEEREKEIILLRYYKGKTQTEVAKIIGVTQVQISRIEKRVLESMRKKLNENTVVV